MFLVKSFKFHMSNLHSSPSFCSPTSLDPCLFLYLVSSYTTFRDTTSLVFPLNRMESKLLLPISFSRNVLSPAIQIATLCHSVLVLLYHFSHSLRLPHERIIQLFTECIDWLKLVKYKLHDCPCLGYSSITCTSVAHGPK